MLLTQSPAIVPTSATRFRSQIHAEGIVNLPEAAAKLAVRFGPGRRCSIPSVFRFIIGGRSGIKLEAARIGGKWFTSEAAIARFVDKVNAHDNAKRPTTAERSVA
jgi:Protein of unknown function (DUF1580)